MRCNCLAGLIILFLLPSVTSGQSIWSAWDSAYSEVNVKMWMNKEIKYAREVDTGMTMGNLHHRMESIRFPAKYKKRMRPIAEETSNSIKRVYNLYGGNPNIIDMIDYEVLIEADGVTAWMPIKKELIKELKRITRKKSKIYLYCHYLNELLEDGRLYHHFLISELHAQQSE